MTKEVELTNKVFESIKHIDSDNNEYWYARELQKALEYKEWRKFENVIKKAKESCKNSNNNVIYHFVGADKMVDIGSKTTRKIDDYKLSRYACYLIAQNGDPRKPVIALAQTYFAVQTRKMELVEQEYEKLSETDKRFYQRNLIKKGNKALNKEARSRGVKNFDKFTNAGYRGLYNGEAANDIFKRKKLRYGENILDNMCSEELVSNLFRITQTEAKLIKDNVKGETNATFTHYTIDNNIREVIMKNGGTLPENLLTPEKSLKTLESEIKKEEKLKIAKSLFSKNMSKEEISEIIGLSIKDIESLNED